MTPLSLLLATVPDDDRAPIAHALERFPAVLLEDAHRAGITLRPLLPRERYAQASPALRGMGVDVDNWPAPPAGLFVVCERTVYLRSRSRMTVAHEFGHAIDCALGQGAYLSDSDPEIRLAFEQAQKFVTPYAATGRDEYFAECLRAFVGGCNDLASYWPDATPERLQTVDPGMYAWLAELVR